MTDTTTGRPYIGKVTKARLPEALRSQIDQLAARYGATVAETTRALLKIAVQENDLQPGRLAQELLRGRRDAEQ